MGVTVIARGAHVTVVRICVELEGAVGAAFRNGAAHGAEVASPAGILGGRWGVLTARAVVACAALSRCPGVSIAWEKRRK